MFQYFSRIPSIIASTASFFSFSSSDLWQLWWFISDSHFTASLSFFCLPVWMTEETAATRACPNMDFSNSGKNVIENWLIYLSGRATSSYPHYYFFFERDKLYKKKKNPSIWNARAQIWTCVRSKIALKIGKPKETIRMLEITGIFEKKRSQISKCNKSI